MKKLEKTETVFLNVKEKIIKGELANGDKLSSVKTLARELGVSNSTIIKAFGLLEKEKLITRINRSGVYVGIKNKNKTTSFKNVPAKTRAQEIADSIISQIIQGDLKVGEYLTLKKVLTFKYTTSKETINKTIEILTDGKYIHKDGFRYRIGQPAKPTHRTVKNRLYVLTNQMTAGWKFFRASQNSFFQEFELELQNYGVTSFEFLAFGDESALINAVEKTDTAGFLINMSNFNTNLDPLEKSGISFKKTLEIIQKKLFPLVVDDYNNLLRLLPDIAVKSEPNTFFLGYDDYKAGEKVGAFLTSLGHKQIAYFNFGNSSGNLRRFNGVESVTRRHFNGESNIHYFQVQSEDAYWAAGPSTFARTPMEKKKHFLEAYSGLFENYQFEHTDPIEEIYPSLANRIYKDIHKKRMAPVFEKSLRIKEITAWIGTGYLDTVCAAEFLLERSIDIPNKISLIGFGDEELTMEYGITIFNFMERRAGYLAAHCILGDIPIKKNRYGFIEHEGQILVRKSVKAI
jgi:DNA-binding transcriptional regulator YhcF (GntR family)